ncbi:MAG: hypothetical protein JSW43_09030 [Gemmatimonadota bacterium]|nr:MAG: hypothetical protein JSW43_09030 [Gemmatimonadota bacterium]
MTPPSERAPHGGLGRLVAGAIAFALVAPLALAALPLAALLLGSSPRTRGETVTAGIAAGVSAWWLLGLGELPDQMVRAAAVLTTAFFVVATFRTQLSVIHRGLVAVTGAAAGVVALLAALGSSWGELQWWVARRASHTARILMGQIWFTRADPAPEALQQLEAWLGTVVQFLSDFFPAVTLLQLLAGLALATAVYERVALRPVGVPPRRLRDFRFNEHLGWAVVVPLIVVLIPKLGAFKAAAANILLASGALYALRGAAVAVFGLQLVGAGGTFLTALLAVIFLLVLPAALGGAILLGVLDAGLDLRRRWTPPSVRD